MNNSLPGLINASVLLTDQRKQELLAAAPTLSDEAGAALRAGLEREPGLILDAVRDALETDAGRHNEKLMEALARFVTDSRRALRMASEADAKIQDKQALDGLEHLFAGDDGR